MGDIRARRFKRKSERVLKVIRNAIVALLLIIVTIGGVMYGSHTIDTRNEMGMLANASLYKQVEVENGRNINVATYGNNKSGHTIVPIAGIGNNDFTVYTQHIVATMKEMTQVAFIDRAGYGFSDDSNNDQTVEQIISDYRTALKNVGVNGPYILLAHEFGGVYATYWAAKYPTEVEAIVYLDGTVISETITIHNKEISKKDVMTSILCKLGFQRLSYYDFYNHPSKALTKQEADCMKALNVHSTYTRAYLSELSLMGDNYNAVLNEFKSTSMPKAYISSANAFVFEEDVIKYYEYKNEQNADLGLEPFYVLGDNEEQVSADVEKFIAECKAAYKSETRAFSKALGNCQLTRMPGDKKIYEQKPEAVTDALKDFLLYLNGDIGGIKEYYEDTRVINWENFDEEHRAESYNIPTDPYDE